MKKSAVLILAVLFFDRGRLRGFGRSDRRQNPAEQGPDRRHLGRLPPLTFKTKDQKITGLDFDLAKLIAKAVGAELKIVEMPFPELIPALEKGKIDLVISSMTITPKRNLLVSFAGPYFMTGQSFVLTKEMPSRSRPLKI